MGQLIMLATLSALIVLIFGLVWYLDPEARGPRPTDGTAPGGEQ